MIQKHRNLVIFEGLGYQKESIEAECIFHTEKSTCPFPQKHKIGSELNQ